jgi:hypothetical protein
MKLDFRDLVAVQVRLGELLAIFLMHLPDFVSPLSALHNIAVELVPLASSADLVTGKLCQGVQA